MADRLAAQIKRAGQRDLPDVRFHHHPVNVNLSLAQCDLAHGVKLLQLHSVRLQLGRRETEVPGGNVDVGNQ